MTADHATPAAPLSIWAYKDNFDFRTDIDEKSPFYVDLSGERGEYSRSALLKEFEIDKNGQLLPGVRTKQHAFGLFGGHVGSGKSTELRSLATLLKLSYTVSHLELTKTLDINNLRYSDLLIALAQKIVGAFEGNSLTPDPIFLKPVTDWFETRIVQQTQFKDIDMELKTQARGQTGIPFLVQFLAIFNAKIKTGATYREELRNEIRNNFTQLVQSFNALITHANDLLKLQQKGPLLFIIDGTDKLSRDDSKDFFTNDVNQLGQIQTNLIVCAPISVLLEEGVTAQRFDFRQRLPMVKIYEKNETERPSAIEALVELVNKRMPLYYFDNTDTVRYLARMSGGHPRDLIRLVRECFKRMDAAPITLGIAERAVKDIATEYQRSIFQEDWSELVTLDKAMGADTDRNEIRMRLLYDLLLLEYNNYWWRSHPLVRTLAGYSKQLKQHSAPSSSPIQAPDSAA